MKFYLLINRIAVLCPFAMPNVLQYTIKDLPTICTTNAMDKKSEGFYKKIFFP